MNIFHFFWGKPRLLRDDGGRERTGVLMEGRLLAVTRMWGVPGLPGSFREGLELCDLGLRPEGIVGNCPEILPSCWGDHIMFHLNWDTLRV